MTWDRRLYFPSEGRLRIFSPLKIRRLRPARLPLDHRSRLYGELLYVYTIRYFDPQRKSYSGLRTEQAAIWIQTLLDQLEKSLALSILNIQRLLHTRFFNCLNTQLNPICHLLALLGPHHILHVSRIRVNAGVLNPDALSQTAQYSDMLSLQMADQGQKFTLIFKIYTT